MKKKFKIAAMTVGALLITSGNTWAATVYDKVELFQTETFFTDSFAISEAGAYKATLTDFNFPAPMIATGMSVTTTTDSLDSLLAPGSFMFNATPGTYFVSFFGTADILSPSQLGMYGIDISAIDINAVPVPAAVWLFGSGLIGLTVAARRKAQY